MKVFKTLVAGLFIAIMILDSSCMRQVKREIEPGNTLLLPIKNERMVVSGTVGRSPSEINGEILFAMMPSKEGLRLKMSSMKLLGGGVKTQEAETGSFSIMLSGDGSSANYDPERRTITSEFTVEVHYPLIDKVRGYQKPSRAEIESDDFRSYTETFSGRLVCRLKEPLRLVKQSRERVVPKGAKLELELKATKATVGEIKAIQMELELEYIVIVHYLNIGRYLNVQPVFIRYTPETGCASGETATTGGSYVTLRDKAIEMWNRCCLRLNFLPVVYVNDDDYRVLSEFEDGSLRSEYDDATAVEVFFCEVGDPVGLWGGGACWSGGTANAQIITFDTNLPINLYNLAHELGHALGLHHPPGDSTPGSLMEPSGFCLDNPALMSDLNCDNADNPLVTTPRVPPFGLCWRDTNMP